ncbi:NYN domain-containing protein [Methylococcus sp. EFPC2]|uniref:NYN domain-containing protein n=1 Tax=Methylococcus sp. EFPC2 TaxID=2812648 RepID=UPI001966D917|nr:NYN domain-containing protein [Methylococcus sp. EFPC2]QSA96900.1 NYN domain-containing protein [Methylococcus sp. EFPC2]
MSVNNKGIQSKFAVKIESEDAESRLAVLIDADNAQPSIIEGLLAEIAKFGIASVKRIYGDWTQPQLGGWKKVLLQHSIQPVQQFGYTKGKNATDSSLIIDAMDLLYTRRFDGFCLVSSDSDFTRLASRLREEGLVVYGFGEKKTPQPFVSACDKFVYTEILRVEGEVLQEVITPKESDKPVDKQKLIELVITTVDDVSEDSGWAHLGAVGSNINKLSPGFDPRLYGFKKFSDLVKSLNVFDIEERSSNSSGAKSVYIRKKH